MKVNIFDFDDYRPALREVLLAKKAAHGRLFTFERLAKTCRVQKSYLSRALGGHAHLSEDQLEIATDFLGLTAAEANYLRLLYSYQRTTYRKRRTRLGTELRAAQLQSQRSENVIKAPAIKDNTGDAALYHLDPDAVLVHMFLTVPRFAENPKLIAQSLALSPKTMADVLSKLERLGFITSNNGKHFAAIPNAHLRADSPLARAHALMQRTKAFERLMRTDVEETGYHFSVVFSADKDAVAKTRRRFLTLLEEMQKEVRAAPPEGVYQMNLDLFSWCD